MYVKDMTLAEAHMARAELSSRTQGRLTAGELEQITWDLEDVDGRISELTDWY